MRRSLARVLFSLAAASSAVACHSASRAAETRPAEVGGATTPATVTDTAATGAAPAPMPEAPPVAAPPAPADPASLGLADEEQKESGRQRAEKKPQAANRVPTASVATGSGYGVGAGRMG